MDPDLFAAVQHDPVAAALSVLLIALFYGKPPRRPRRKAGHERTRKISSSE